MKYSRKERNIVRQQNAATARPTTDTSAAEDRHGPVFFWRESEEPYGFLCQWYPSHFQDLDVHPSHTFNCAEQYMMYRKALIIAEHETEASQQHGKRKAGKSSSNATPPGPAGTRHSQVGEPQNDRTRLPDMILAEQKPGEQKQLARVSFTMKKWESIKYDVVVRGSHCKFSQNPELRQRLLETGDRDLFEASPSDKVWGIGFAAEYAELHRHDWGSNLLGKALMSVRAQLQAELLEEEMDLDGI